MRSVYVRSFSNKWFIVGSTLNKNTIIPAIIIHSENMFNARMTWNFGEKSNICWIKWDKWCSMLKMEKNRILEEQVAFDVTNLTVVTILVDRGDNSSSFRKAGDDFDGACDGYDVPRIDDGRFFCLFQNNKKMQWNNFFYFSSFTFSFTLENLLYIHLDAAFSFSLYMFTVYIFLISSFLSLIFSPK